MDSPSIWKAEKLLFCIEKAEKLYILWLKSGVTVLLSYVKVHIKLSSLINLWAWYFGFFDWALFQMTAGIKVTVITV